jgi:hypothetical protein
MMSDQALSDAVNQLRKYVGFAGKPTTIERLALNLADANDALEAKFSKMEGGLRELSDPMAYEHIGKFHGRKYPWSVAKEALAAPLEHLK